MPTHSIRLKSASSQYLSASDSASLSITGACTFEFWIKPITASSDPLIFDKSNGTASQSMGYVQLDMTNKFLKFVNTDGSGYGDASVTIPTMVAGVWYHLALTFSSGTIEVFFNGKSMGTATGTLKTSMPDSSAPLQIGRYQAGASNYLDAHLKHLRIFNDVRTGSEILSDMYTEAVSNANLVAEWALDNALTDASGNSNTLTNNNSALFSVDVPWKAPTGVESSNYALRLQSASSMFASATDHADLKPSGDFTVEAWVNVKSVSSTPLIFQSFSADATPKGIELRLDSDSVPQILVDNQQCKAVTVLKKGQWYHVAGALSGTTLKIYVNGVLENTATVTVQTYAATNYVRIGARKISASGESLFWNGLIKEVRLFNDERSQSEILSDALASTVSNANLKAEWKLDNAYTDGSGGSHTLTGSNSPTFHKWANAIHGGVNAYYKLDDVNDATGLGETLTNTNTVTFSTGKKGNAADFGSSNSNKTLERADADVAPNFDTVHSFSFWVKINTAPSSGNSYYLFFNDSSNGNTRIGYENSGGTLRLQLSRGSGGFLNNTTFNYTLTVGTWFHIVMVYRGSTSGAHELYVNGALLGTQTSTTTTGGGWGGAATLSLAERATDDTLPASIMLDEFIVYERDITFGEVLDLYSNGNAITYEGSVNITISPSAQVGTFSIPAYSVLLDRVISVAAQVATFSVPAYTVSLPKIVLPSAQVATFSIPTYTVDAGGNITLAVNAQVATFSIPAYSILRDWVVAVAAPVTATFSTPTPTIATGDGVTILASAVVGTFSIPAYSLVLEANRVVAVGVVTATFSLPSLAKVGAIWRKIARSTNDTWSRVSRNSS